ncbi:efflux RND transporter permease subunit [Curtobacterium sp. Leaf261]|uniref:efflux RND transporter permease subunit n=1 Tax=Curtobacterium sp. Leaf261 TaxID=1736311 RepID=UPI0007003370|nr:efflux RND transporter permease subunit [Curtobacterium sp. Leaf261]KQO61484.1 hydrogenase expression protein [Curtobacterium sp. Leaf261]
MHLLSVFSLRNRALIALVTVVVAIFGGIALTNLKQELIPSVQFPQVAIVSVYPGATPEVVSNDVSTKIEQGIQAVPDLKSTTATSSTGQSVVSAEFDYGSNLASAEDKIQTVVNALSLPDSVQTQIVTGSFDDIPVLQLAVSDPGADQEQLVDKLNQTAIPDLEKLDGVRQADVYGNPGRRIVITPDTDALTQRGLSQTAISDALDDNGTLIPGGTITENGKTLSIQSGQRLASVDDIGALPLTGAKDALGQPEAATIGDVATVELTEAPRTSISRVNGKEALTVAITKTQQANTVDVSKTVSDALPAIEAKVGGNLGFTVVFDQAPYIQQSIDSLAEEGLLGLGFAVIVILVFLLSWRSTLVTVVSIPVSVLLAAIGMQAAGYTLNIITLAGITIAIGRVVDDSIVVIENIKRHLQPGVDRRTAVLDGVREVAGAVTASTITTVVVFLPVAFVQELVGELFRPFALTVTMALVASLLVALTIVPVLAYWLLRAPKAPAHVGAHAAGASRVGARAASAAPVGLEERGTSATEGTLTSAADLHDASAPDRLRRGYQPVLAWVLRFPWLVIVLAVMVLGGTAAALPFVKTNYLGDSGQNTFTVTQTLPPATSLAEQSSSADRVERVLRRVPGVDTVQVTIGSSGNSLQAAFSGGAGGAITYSVTTDADRNQTDLQSTARARLKALSGAGDIAMSSSSSFGSDSNIEVDVTAPTQDQLRTASQQVLRAMRDVPNTTGASSNLSSAQPFLQVKVDRSKAAADGLTETEVGGIVAASVSPQSKGTVEFGDATLDIYIENATPPTTADALRALSIPTATGSVPLSDLATVAEADGPTSVTTSDAVRTATISVTPSATNLGAATTSVTQAVDDLDLPRGASASIGGVASSQTNAFGQLGLAALIAILIVYVVMVATFKSLYQPLMLLVSIPFAATGAVVLQIVSGIPIGVPSLIGLLMLVGIVVTNAIVLIDLVNQYRRRGLRVREALVEGATRRLRPILMTALATVFALVPMAIGLTGQGGFISQPLALIVIGGLVSSTVLTLIVLPALYSVVEGWLERRADRRAGLLPPKRPNAISRFIRRWRSRGRTADGR